MTRTRTWNVALRVLLAVLGLVAVVLRSLDATGIWSQQGWLELGVVVVIGLVACVDGVRGALRESRAPQRERLRARLQKATVGALKSVVGMRHDIDLAELGGSVFVVRRRGWSRREELHRVLRFRLDEHPQPSAVRWTKGKGTIGRAWASRTPQHAVLTPVARQWGADSPQGAVPTPQEYGEIPSRARTRFTHEEFVGIAGKYAEVIAVPILAEGEHLIGVFAMDLPMTSTAPGLGTLLAGPDVEAVAIAAASLLGDVLT